MTADGFATRLLHWYDRHGRKDLPWQHPITAYRVWVSEIMLQQTQVSTVIPYFQRFVERFPDVAALADADRDEVLHHWTGLGYYARARNLHRAARQVMEVHGGTFPRDVEALVQLPGIGRSTAGAVAAIAFGRHAAILDGNVKRVLARYHAVPGYPGDAQPQKILWRHAEAHTPERRVADYTQAIMDLGATVCTRRQPRCGDCPVRRGCVALARDEVARFPERRASRPKPVRAARLFMVTDPAGRCLLEQRPQEGLWGGLWTPPQREADTPVARLCRDYGIPDEDVVESAPAPSFRHTFTHFHLDIEPVYVTLARNAVLAAERTDLRWFSPDAGDPLGLSAPAARLLEQLYPGAISR
ncbi:MAG: A/G-specific adenine glycosylase [Pseudomonadota bacterium]